MSQRSPGASPRIRTTIGLITLSIVIPAVGGAIAIPRVEHAFQDRTQEGHRVTAHALATQVSHDLGFAEQFARSLAHRPGIVQWVRRGDREAQVRVLQNSFGTTSLFRTFAVYDLTGRLLSRYPTDPLSPPADRPPVLPERSDPEIVDGDAILVVAEPMSDPDTRAVGLLQAEISIKALAAEVAGLRLGETGRASIVNREGRVLISGDPMRTGTTLLAPNLLAMVQGRSEGSARFHSEVTDRAELAALSPIAGTEWSVLLSQTQAEAFAAVQRLRNGLMLLLIVLGLLGSGIGALIWATSVRHERSVDAKLAEMERLNEALDAFGARAAHDLSAPLTAINLAAQILEKRVESMTPNERVALDVILRQVDRGDRLVKDLLGFARASATPHPEPLAFTEIVKEAARDVEALTLRLDAPDTIVFADRIALRQAMENLLQNAARYGRMHGRAEVTVSLEEGAEGWDIKVADRGPGIPLEEAERIFVPFQRGTNAREKPGSGLGLAIVSTVANAHGGRAWYEPRDGGGAVFRLFLPRGHNVAA